ncbi:MAG: hypothetical protein LBQ60_04415, partial [Bacteroidales bacterium]|nr:hypothetical protein [Bacteroidales bacterium]
MKNIYTMYYYNIVRVLMVFLSVFLHMTANGQGEHHSTNIHENNPDVPAKENMDSVMSIRYREARARYEAKVAALDSLRSSNTSRYADPADIVSD